MVSSRGYGRRLGRDLSRRFPVRPRPKEPDSGRAGAPRRATHPQRLPIQIRRGHHPRRRHERYGDAPPPQRGQLGPWSRRHAVRPQRGRPARLRGSLPRRFAPGTVPARRFVRPSSPIALRCITPEAPLVAHTPNSERIFSSLSRASGTLREGPMRARAKEGRRSDIRELSLKMLRRPRVSPLGAMSMFEREPARARARCAVAEVRRHFQAPGTPVRARTPSERYRGPSRRDPEPSASDSILRPR